MRSNYPFTSICCFENRSIVQGLSSDILSTKMPDSIDLPPCVRHITTHGPDGKSLYHSSTSPKFFQVLKLGRMARSYSANDLPADLSDDNDLKTFEGLTEATSHRRREIFIPNGANLNVVDIRPGGFSVMHQTSSVDFSICVLGTIDHELDSGQVVRLRPGVSNRVPTPPSADMILG